LLSNDASNTSALAYDEFGVQEIFPIQPTQAQTQPQQNPQAQTRPHSRTSPIFENPFGFTGYQLDDITNMHYAQARYYAANNGRFIAEDPIQDQLNWYGYCNANPMTSVDPTGLSPVDFMPCPFTGEFVYVGTSPTQSPERPSTPSPGSGPTPSSPTQPSNQGGRGNRDCPGPNPISPVDFVFCPISGDFVLVDSRTGMPAVSSPGPAQLSTWERGDLTNSQQIFVATIAGEGIGQGQQAWQWIGQVIVNRADDETRWTQHTTTTAVIQNTGFDAYSHRNPEFQRAMNYLVHGDVDAFHQSIYANLINTVLPIYYRTASDVTGGATHFYSPVSMLIRGSSPRWASSYERIYEGDVGEDGWYFRFLR